MFEAEGAKQQIDRRTIVFEHASHNLLAQALAGYFCRVDGQTRQIHNAGKNAGLPINCFPQVNLTRSSADDGDVFR